MAHLEKLFVSEGLPDRPYHTLDSHVVYKSETATAEMKEIKPVVKMNKDFHPITTEIHVTELRPIKLDPVGKRGASESQYPPESGTNQMWERRLQSESALTESRPQVSDHGYEAEFSTESHRVSSSQTHTMSQRTQRHDVTNVSHPELQSNIVRTVTSRTGSYSGSSPGSSPSATLSPPSVRRRDKLTAEFKRRDVSPDFRMSDQKVTMVDGKCNCCPYGYHVDVDFMTYCDTMSNQSYLKQLKRIQREKRKLRKSMEVYLQDQERTDGRTEIVNPMENHTHYQESTTNKILDEIDTSVDQTLTSIETMMKTSQYSDTGTATVNTAPLKFNTFPKKVGRQVAQELQSYNETFTATLNNHERADSNSSLSSISTVASERVNPYSPGFSTTETVTTRTTNMTSQQLAETMATHLPMEDGAASPQSNTMYISKQSLHAIREAMAVSLQRMKDLEEQVKAIPVLQVRISVLKEEKRLLNLQMKAQNQVHTVSRGVGDATVDTPLTPVHSPRFEFGLKSPPPTAPKPKVRMAAVGDHSVLEPYLLQPELSSSYTTQDNSTHVFERETIIIDRAQKQHAIYKPESSKPITRSVGVGEGNVFDDSMHIHEKELRTVIIGQNVSTGKRNVGIECRVPTRDVGVSYNFDSFEKPATRTVGVTTETTALVTSVSFKSEEFTSALKNALSKNVCSKAIQVDSKSQYRNVGIQYSTSVWDVRSVGVGDCSIDVEVRNPVARRSVSIDAFPDRMNRSTNTDYGWRLDSSTNTVTQYTEQSWTQTEQLRTSNAFTSTDRKVNYNVSCQTDIKVFAATDQLRSMGTNTEKTLTYSTGMNTILRPLSDRGTNTIKQKNTRNHGVNTDEPAVRNVGCSEDRIDSFVCDLDEKNSEDEYRFEEEGIETKTIYYATTADEEVSKADKGYEIKREYSDNTYAVESSQKKRKESEAEETYEDEEEVVEERVWRTSGDGQFTVTTVTTRRVFGKDGDTNAVTESKTVTGGPEVLGSDAAAIQREVARGKRSSAHILDTETESVMTGSTMQTSGSSFRSSSSSSGFSGMESSESKNQGDTAIERVLGSEFARSLEKSSDLTSGGEGSQTTTEFSVNEGGLQSSASILSDELDNLRGRMSDSGLSSQMSSSSENSSTYTTIVQDGAGSPTVTVTERRFRSGDGSPQREMYSRSYDSGLSSTGSGSSSSSSEVISKTISSSSQFSEDISPSGTLKSIMKKSQSDPGGQKRGITFAETVVGGFELSVEMKGACQTLATYLEDSTMIQTKQLNASLNVIQAEWFKVSSSKLADAHQVEDYLSCFNEICKRTLEYIVNMQDSNGNTAIHYAVSNCNFEIVNLLLDTGTCDLNKMNKAGYTAVIMATLASIVTQRQEEVVQRLFSMGNVNSKAAKDGQTALMFAVRQGRTEMVKMLLDTGADTNIQDDEGSTALMCASEHGHTEIIKMLLNSPGCEATISDNDGSTALSIAMEAGHKDAGVLLYAHVNFGPGQSAAPVKKTRKTSNTSPLPST